MSSPVPMDETARAGSTRPAPTTIRPVQIARRPRTIAVAARALYRMGFGPPGPGRLPPSLFTCGVHMRYRSERSTVRLWGGLILGWWTLNGFATATQYHLFHGMDGVSMTWSETLITSMMSAYLWIPITVFALWSSWRFPLDRVHLATRLPLHAAAGGGPSSFRAGAVVALNDWVGWYRELPPFSQILERTSPTTHSSIGCWWASRTRSISPRPIITASRMRSVFVRSWCVRNWMRSARDSSRTSCSTPSTRSHR